MAPAPVREDPVIRPSTANHGCQRRRSKHVPRPNRAGKPLHLRVKRVRGGSGATIAAARPRRYARTGIVASAVPGHPRDGGPARSDGRNQQADGGTHLWRWTPGLGMLTITRRGTPASCRNSMPAIARCRRTTSRSRTSTLAPITGRPTTRRCDAGKIIRSPPSSLTTIASDGTGTAAVPGRRLGPSRSRLGPIPRNRDSSHHSRAGHHIGCNPASAFASLFEAPAQVAKRRVDQAAPLPL